MKHLAQFWVGTTPKSGSNFGRRQHVVDGVEWGIEEAAAAHAGWFEQFPEVAFQMALTMLLGVVDEPVKMLLKNRYEGGAAVKNVALLRSETLGGRQICAADDRLINAAAQGTGADMLMRSLATLPTPAAEKLIMVVHDSMIFEVPVEQARPITAMAVSTMISAADFYLRSWGIPATVDVKTGQSWSSLR